MCVADALYGRYGGAAWERDGQWGEELMLRDGRVPAGRLDGCGCQAGMPEAGVETEGRAAAWSGYDAALTYI